MSIDRRIDQICDKFEACWTAGDRPSLFDCLKQADGVDQVTLLRELLPIDIEYRNRLTMPVMAEEYAVFGQEAVQIAAKMIAELRSSRAQELRMSESSDEDLTLLPKQTGLTDEATSASLAIHDEFATIPPRAKAGTSTSRNANVRYFGDYELLSEIARGGMGVVYKARQVNLNRVVALKMILAGHLASDEDVQRFRTEAEAAANLDHPGIVPIYEIGQHEGQHFFSMGYVDGQSLADRLKYGPLPPKLAAEFTRKIAEAIAYAHENGVIHRDLKPANVLLDRSGEPRVTDFGLARKTDADSSLTKTGAVMGTPSYMPPEQAAGQTYKVGPMSDVYSLGAILYCLLTGRPPFQAASPIDTLMQVMEKEPVSIRLLNPKVPKDLETISLKCLQKDRGRRYASARHLVADIERWQAGAPIRARSISRTEHLWRWTKKHPAITALTLLSMGVVVAAFYVQTLFGIQSRKAESNAIAAAAATKATLARSNYYLSMARWEQNRVQDARDLLEKIPEEHRHFEWHLATRV